MHEECVFNYHSAELDDRVIITMSLDRAMYTLIVNYIETSSNLHGFVAEEFVVFRDGVVILSGTPRIEAVHGNLPDSIHRRLPR